MTLPIPEKFLFFFLAMPLGMQDLSYLTRDQTQALAVKVPSPNHWTAREFPEIPILTEKELIVSPRHQKPPAAG